MLAVYAHGLDLAICHQPGGRGRRQAREVERCYACRSPQAGAQVVQRVWPVLPEAGVKQHDAAIRYGPMRLFPGFEVGHADLVIPVVAHLPGDIDFDSRGYQLA